MIKIGLTGNIAAGKSQAEKFFEEKNIPVIDADKICRELLANDKTIIEAIKQTFQGTNIETNGALDRKKLSTLIFNDERAKKKLEAIIHPSVKMRIIDFIKDNQNRDKVIVSIPLLFEAGMENLFDKIIFISANEKIRLERLMLRNNISEDIAKTMLASQLPESVKIPKADYVIHNNSELRDFYIELDKLYTSLLH